MAESHSSIFEGPGQSLKSWTNRVTLVAFLPVVRMPVLVNLALMDRIKITGTISVVVVSPRSHERCLGTYVHSDRASSVSMVVWNLSAGRLYTSFYGTTKTDFQMAQDWSLNDRTE